MAKMIISSFTGEYHFLSNFHPSPILFRGETYPTAEHLFQALKTRDGTIRKQIRLATVPGIAKMMGKSIHLRGDWEEVKYKLMYMVVKLKFQQNPELKEALLATKNGSLLEGNTWHDNYWGSCFCKVCLGVKEKNQLGKILMSIRRILS